MPDPTPVLASRPQRSAAEIRASIETNREALAGSLARLKGDYRATLAKLVSDANHRAARRCGEDAKAVGR